MKIIKKELNYLLMDCPVAEKLAEPFSFTSKLCEMTSTSITTFSRACVPADSVRYIK